MTKLTLSQMLANQKGSSDAPVQEAPPVVESAAVIEQVDAPAEAGHDLPKDDSPKVATGGLAFLKGAAKPATIPVVAEGSTTQQPPKAGGLAFLAKGSGGGTSQDTGKPTVSAPTKPAVLPEAAAPPKSNLETLMESTGGTLGIASRFADEIPATAPLRELPPELAEQAVSFTKSLDSVYQCLHEPELLGGVIRGIMIELSNHPEYRKLISPMDYHTMVKGMRESMGLARIKKEESKAKRTGSKKSTVVTDLDALNALEGMNFD